MSIKEMFSLRIFAFVVLGVLCVSLCIFPRANIIIGLKAKHDTKAAIEQNKLLNREIVEIQNKIDQLRSNPDTLEKFAREQFYFAAPGDDVYVIAD